MAVQRIDINTFLELARQYPVLDVRSPAEYAHAHLPGAHSLPLFSDEERKTVGTLYKQQSREQAIKAGLDFFGNRMRNMVEQTEKLLRQHPEGENSGNTPTVLIHCWRGGMRSAAVAWLLDLYGFNVYSLEGGYKAFRHWALQQFEPSYPFAILGGYTGSGKTYVLQALQQQHQPTIDLEGLAHHKGSAFGNIGMPPQPSQEQFENKLALELHQLPADKPFWVEDESQRIGDVNIPISLWKQMRKSPVYFLEIPFDERLQHLVKEYGALNKERIVNAIIRIRKRLGGLETKEAIAALVEDDIESCFRILLRYYDRWYEKGLHNREQPHTLIHKIPCSTVTNNNTIPLLKHII